MYFWYKTGTPSPPRNPAFNINETAVFLEWSPPSDTGGRKDVTYNVLCLRCGADGQPCEACNSNVRFVPRPAGLTSTSVVVQDFVAHANYTFQIEALNGVSGMGRSTRQVANITVSTEQAGKTWFFLALLVCKVIKSRLILLSFRLVCILCWDRNHQTH